MRWLMTFRIALRALARNKLRAFLTMLGIIIGVGAVIAMVAIGEGAKSTIRSQIAALGTNVLIVLPGSNVQGGVRAGTGNVNTLVDSDARAMTRELRSVAYASPVLRRQEQIVAGNLNWGTLAQGVAPEFEQIRDWQIESGRFLHEGDMDSAAKVAVIGQTVARQLFGNDDPIDAVIRIRNIPFRIVGVLVAKGQTGQGQDQDDTVMIPYTTMQKRLMRITFVQSIVVRAVSAEKVAEAQEQITLLLRQRHRIADGREDDFTVRNLSDIAEAAQSTARVMAVLLGSVAGDLAAGRRHRHHEHHAGVGHRTHPRDRHPHGRRRAQQGHHAAISRRGCRHGRHRRHYRHPLGYWQLRTPKNLGPMADPDRSDRRCRRFSFLRRRRRLLRFLSRQKSGGFGSNRCAEI